jgi:zinc protease
MTRRLNPAVAIALTAYVGACAPASTASTVGFDRSVMPSVGPSPSIDFPEVQRLALSNGLQVWLVERSDLPLVTVQLLLNAGAIAEPADRAGLASLTAAMLTQGTSSRSATQIAEETEFLATNLTANSGRESAVVATLPPLWKFSATW